MTKIKFQGETIAKQSLDYTFAKKKKKIRERRNSKRKVKQTNWMVVSYFVEIIKL